MTKEHNWFYQKHLPSRLENIANGDIEELNTIASHLEQYPNATLDEWNDESNFRNDSLQKLETYFKSEKKKNQTDSNYKNKTVYNTISNVIEREFNEILSDENTAKLLTGILPQSSIDILKNIMILTAHDKFRSKIITEVTNGENSIEADLFKSYVDQFPLNEIIKESLDKEITKPIYQSYQYEDTERINHGRAMYDDYGPEEIEYRKVTRTGTRVSRHETIDKWRDVGQRYNEIINGAKRHATDNTYKTIISLCEEKAKHLTKNFVMNELSLFLSDDLKDKIKSQSNEKDNLNKETEIDYKSQEIVMSEFMTQFFPKISKDLHENSISKYLNFNSKKTIKDIFELLSESYELVDEDSDWEDTDTIPGYALSEYSSFIEEQGFAKHNHKNLKYTRDEVQKAYNEQIRDLSDNEEVQYLFSSIPNSVKNAMFETIKKAAWLHTENKLFKKEDELYSGSHYFFRLVHTSNCKSGRVNFNRQDYETRRQFEERISHYVKNNSDDNAEGYVQDQIKNDIHNTMKEFLQPYFERITKFVVKEE